MPQIDRPYKRKPPHTVRGSYPGLMDLTLLDDAARRLGSSGQGLFEYYSHLGALRDAQDDVGRAALAERAARAELHTRVILSAGLDALNEMHDFGLIQQTVRTAIKKPQIINDTTMLESIRHAGAVLKQRYPAQQWDWLESGAGLLSDVEVQVESNANTLHATIKQSGKQTIVYLSPGTGQRVDIRKFFSAGSDRIYASSVLDTSTVEPKGAISAYDSAINSLAIVREWIYLHARNAAETGAPARTGAAPAAIIIVALVVIAIAVEVVAAIEFYICKHDNDTAACKWSEILSTFGFALLGAAGGGSQTGGSGSSSGPYMQFGTNPQ